MQIDLLKKIVQRYQSTRLATTLCVTICFTLLMFSSGFVASQNVNELPAASFKLVELYTSQGCSSCPPADKFLAQLIDDDSHLIALEFHVDYWNSLIHGNNGNFVDPYSSSQFSMRQREYYQAQLSGRPGVYTPQIVVNGRVATVGSNHRYIQKVLDTPAFAAIDVEISESSDAAYLNISLDAAKSRSSALVGSDIMLARYLDSTVTQITGGENNDKLLHNHNVVTSFEKIGQVPASGGWSVRIDAPSSDMGCVVLVQATQLEALHNAVACP